MKKKKISKTKNKIVRGKINGKTRLSEVMKINPNSAEILFEVGMHCIGCGMASGETLEQGCLAHGMSKKETEKLIKKLNGGK
ncbi:MAG: DUF1858 domain-containing protein [Nanoarchaeota archaeon]